MQNNGTDAEHRADPNADNGAETCVNETFCHTNSNSVILIQLLLFAVQNIVNAETFAEHFAASRTNADSRAVPYAVVRAEPRAVCRADAFADLRAVMICKVDNVLMQMCVQTYLQKIMQKFLQC